MKLTKRQLKEIIKEEYLLLLKEAGTPPSDRDRRKYWTAAVTELQNALRGIVLQINNRNERKEFIEGARKHLNKELDFLLANVQKGDLDPSVTASDTITGREQALAGRGLREPAGAAIGQTAGVSVDQLAAIGQRP